MVGGTLYGLNVNSHPFNVKFLGISDTPIRDSFLFSPIPHSRICLAPLFEEFSVTSDDYCLALALKSSNTKLT